VENLITKMREGRLQAGDGLVFGVHRARPTERVQWDVLALTKDCQVGRKPSGQPYRYHILTYGCQMNEHDTETMAGLLQAMNYEPTTELEQADFILFNTCAVREHAEDKVFGQIGRLRPLKYANPDLLIGLCGCMAQEEHVQELVRTKFPWIDVVFGTHNLHRLPMLLRDARQSRMTVMEVWDFAPQTLEDLPKVRAAGVRAWVNIQYGCNKFCTYCIVPHTRGAERSRQPADILGEIRELAEQGYREVTLLGQNVNDYGVDLQGTSFAQLLREVNGVDGIDRIRFTTSNPWNFTNDLIDAVASCEKVVEHIHLPVQSGSNRILQRMNRSHTKEYYFSLVERIRRAIPNVSLTTDIIVGFPGETEEQFQETLNLVRDIQFDNAYTFIYSPRENTPAARFADDVSPETKKDRLRRLNDLQYEIALQRQNRFLGQVVEVLVEGPSRTNPEVLAGRTRGNQLVLFPSNLDLSGQYANVEITTPQTWLLKGRFIGVKEVSA
jgi:tRNA-2-methylthio-N6-dimethylallyladenosine synthase